MGIANGHVRYPAPDISPFRTAFLFARLAFAFATRRPAGAAVSADGVSWLGTTLTLVGAEKAVIRSG